jgi:hypothetical protein
MDVFDLVYKLSQLPFWYGWLMITAGACALSFLAGLRTGRT